MILLRGKVGHRRLHEPRQVRLAGLSFLDQCFIPVSQFSHPEIPDIRFTRSAGVRGMKTSDPEVRSGASESRREGLAMRSRSASVARGSVGWSARSSRSTAVYFERSVPPGWVRRRVGCASNHIRRRACLSLPRFCVPMWLLSGVVGVLPAARSLCRCRGFVP